MTIKEIEEHSGMTRANIRFYEGEGLLAPKRSANGYRDYSDNDLEILKRIRLLRTLHMPLEEIKALHSGEQELSVALEQLISSLIQQQTELEQSRQICVTMKNDGVRYQTLNAQRYLDIYKQRQQDTGKIPELVEDTVPRVQSPWRRFFARFLDISLYSLVWDLFLMVILHQNISNFSPMASLMSSFVALLLMVVAEPAMLTLFGTTPGKWILGLRVTYDGERRLTYTEGVARTWGVLWRGMGLCIPIYNLVRYWKSYKACEEGDTLTWEYDSTLTLKDEKGWRIPVWIVVRGVVLAVLLAAAAAVQLPKHQGEISVRDFCENYNRFADYYDLEADRYLGSDGHWVRKEPGAGSYVIKVGGDVPDPEFIFTEEKGIMDGMHFTVALKNSDVWAPACQDEMILSILSFAGAGEGKSLLDSEIKQMVNYISDHPFENFEFTVYGVRITCEISYSGYVETGRGMLFPEESTDNEYLLRFSMEKVY